MTRTIYFLLLLFSMCLFSPPALSQDRLNIETAGSFQYSFSNIYDIEVAGDYTYAATSTGLQIFDTQDPAIPEVLGFLPLPSAVKSIVLQDDIAYLLSYENGLYIVDVSDATIPTMLGNYNHDNNFVDFIVYGDFVYSHDDANHLLIIDVNVPTDPNLVDSIGFPGIGECLVIDGMHLYAFSTNGYLYSYDISNPTEPGIVGNLYLDGVMNDMIIYDNHIIASSGGWGMKIIDITDPTDPYVLLSRDIYGIRDMKIRSDSLYSLSNYGLHIYDPNTLDEIFSHSMNVGATHLEFQDNLVFMSCYTMGLQIIDIEDMNNIETFGFIYDPEIITGIDKSDDIIYMASQFPGQITSVNVSSFENLHMLQYSDTPQTYFKLDIQNSLVYSITQDGFSILDISDPDTIQQVGFCDLQSFTFALEVKRTNAYVLTSDYFYVIDISNQLIPTIIGQYEVGYNSSYSVAVDHRHAYIPRNSDGLLILDITDPQNPVESATIDPGHPVEVVDIRGNYAVLAGSGYVTILDLTNPARPVIRSTSNLTLPSREEVVIQNGFAFVNSWAQLTVLDLLSANADGPVVAGYYEYPSYGHDLVVEDELVYVAASDRLLILDCSACFNPLSAPPPSSNGTVPKEYSLSPAVPNPFNSQTKFYVHLPVRSKISLLVHNQLGQQVSSLAEGTYAAGTHIFAFDGRHLASGNYYITLVDRNTPVNAQRVSLIK